MNDTSSPVTVDVRRAETRPRTQLGWLDGRHSFSFGSHHDPSNVGHGLLIVSNDDRVQPSSGFGTHPHQDMEIVTWVLEGELEHRDSEGNVGRLYPGLAQRMSAGTGIFHSEMNPSPSIPVRLVQMWVVPDRRGIAPSYEQRDVNERLGAGGLVPVASGRGHDGAIAIHQAGAVMWVARLTPGETVTLPDAPYVHLFVARGEVVLDATDATNATDAGDGPDGAALAEGDAARLTKAGARTVTASSDAEIIVWESDADSGRR